MARAEVDASPYASTHTNLPHLSSPLPKRSRLSLRRTTQVLHTPCYKEDELCDTKSDLLSLAKEENGNVNMVDLTQDENTPPNCNITSSDVIPNLIAAHAEDNETKVWTLGLPNCGNTCYVNSILQVLRYSPDFLNSLHALLLAQYQLSKVLPNEEETKELIFFKNMHMMYTAMKRKEVLMRINVDKDYCSFLVKPVNFVINSLREISLLFEEGEQHDAHEFLITTTSAFSSLCQSLKKLFGNLEDDKKSIPLLVSGTGPSTVGNDIGDIKALVSGSKRGKSKSTAPDFSKIENLGLGFEGKMRHVVQCLECEKRLEREESFANLEVNIPETENDVDTVDLQQCLSQTTILCGENKFFCEDCNRYNEAKMISEVITLPPILLLHFSWHGNSPEITNLEKTNIKVIIPRSLETSDNTEVFCCPTHLNYKLFAIVLHIGQSTEGGHYVSFIKDASQDHTGPEIDLKLQRLRQMPTEPEHCCSTEEISNFRTASTNAKWLLFDDNVVSPIRIDEDSDTFPYFNYLSITASPSMIFYHKT